MFQLVKGRGGERGDERLVRNGDIGLHTLYQSLPLSLSLLLLLTRVQVEEDWEIVLGKSANHFPFFLWGQVTTALSHLTHLTHSPFSLLDTTSCLSEVAMVILKSGWVESAVPRIRAKPGNEASTSLGSRQNAGSRDHTYQPHPQTVLLSKCGWPGVPDDKVWYTVQPLSSAQSPGTCQLGEE